MYESCTQETTCIRNTNRRGSKTEHKGELSHVVPHLKVLKLLQVK